MEAAGGDAPEEAAAPPEPSTDEPSTPLEEAAVSPAADSPAPAEHLLWCKWVIWEHRRPAKASTYCDSMSPIGGFESVEDFWRHWRVMPSPSKLFLACPAASERHVDSISLFIDGVRPEWEDPSNATGCELFCRRPFAPSQLDRLWHALVFGVVGGSLAGAREHVTGVRVVNKSSAQRVMYRVEVWLRTEDSDPIRAALPAVLLGSIEEDTFGPASDDGKDGGLPANLAHIRQVFSRRPTEKELPSWEHRSHVSAQEPKHELKHERPSARATARGAEAAAAAGAAVEAVVSAAVEVAEGDAAGGAGAAGAMSRGEGAEKGGEEGSADTAKLEPVAGEGAAATAGPVELA